MRELITLLVVAVVAVLASSACRTENWWNSMDRKGWSTCKYSTHYINGLYRNDNTWRGDHIGRLEQAKCCGRTWPFYNQPSVCASADWYRSFDRNHGWNTCPSGHFLRGLYRSGGGNRGLDGIEWGKCCKPAYHPPSYGRCYDKDIKRAFDKKGWVMCEANYFVVGFWRGNGHRLHHIEKMRCCKMVNAIPSIQSMSQMKTRVMDTTLYRLALLAHYLGYGWCAGCRGQYVGDDFIRRRDSWEADKKSHCRGYKSNHRLRIHYSDFSLALKDVRYGRAVIQDLVPQRTDKGPVVNSANTPITTTVTREVSSTRIVTHTTTSTWEVSNEPSLTIGYKPSSATGGVTSSASYTFGFKFGVSTTDSTGKAQTNSFTISQSKKIPPKSAVEWQTVLNRQRVTVPYTATIIVKFSAELDGFLRWGGGYDGGNTNYHVNHRGSGRRPTFNYKIGSEDTPMYKELKKQSTRNYRPWQWNNMKQKYSYARSLIDQLCNENYYEFTLTGQFEDVHGIHAAIQWRDIPWKPRRNDWKQADQNVSQPTEDPEWVFPDPPKADIKLPNQTAIPPVVPMGDVNDTSSMDSSSGDSPSGEFPILGSTPIPVPSIAPSQD